MLALQSPSSESTLPLTCTCFDVLLLLCQLVKSPVLAATTGGGLMGLLSIVSKANN